MTPEQRKLYNLKNWIRTHKLKFSKADKYTIDQWARELLQEWIDKYGKRAVLKAEGLNIGCSGTRQMEDLIRASKQEIEDDAKRREKMRKEMEQYQIT
ncbi:hypothetical protein KBA63_00225 [Candidatus Woesebacteria bacterium]|nr:hypothetical protein [Candidatus Woesebacteria bacterium]